MSLKNATNSVASPAKYTIIKRTNATSPWVVSGNYTLASILTNTVSASNTGLTSFSDFAMGISNNDVVLATNVHVKDASILNIFPNPTNSELNLKLPSNLENGSLKIISLTGQIVFEKQNLSGTDFSFDVADLRMGIYIIQISEGNKSYNSKFVKQ